MIYCQDKMLFRFDYVDNQAILTPEHLTKMQRIVKVVEVDVSKSLNFMNIDLAANDANKLGG